MGFAKEVTLGAAVHEWIIILLNFKKIDLQEWIGQFLRYCETILLQMRMSRKETSMRIKRDYQSAEYVPSVVDNFSRADPFPVEASPVRVGRCIIVRHPRVRALLWSSIDRHFEGR